MKKKFNVSTSIYFKSIDTKSLLECKSLEDLTNALFRLNIDYFEKELERTILKVSKEYQGDLVKYKFTAMYGGFVNLELTLLENDKAYEKRKEKEVQTAHLIKVQKQEKKDRDLKLLNSLAKKYKKVITDVTDIDNNNLVDTSRKT